MVDTWIKAGWSRPHVAVEISSTTLRCVAIVNEDHAWRVVMADDYPLAVGIVEGSVVQQEALFAEICQQVLGKYVRKRDKVAMALPESFITRHTISVQAALHEAALLAWIEMELATLLPFPVTEAMFDYQRISVTPQQQEIQIVVTHHEVIHSWQRTLKRAGYALSFIEPAEDARSRFERQEHQGALLPMMQGESWSSVCGVAMRLSGCE